MAWLGALFLITLCFASFAGSDGENQMASEDDPDREYAELVSDDQNDTYWDPPNDDIV